MVAKNLLPPMDNIGPNGSLNNNNDSFLRAILQVRNTPDPDCNISPAQDIVREAASGCIFLRELTQ